MTAEELPVTTTAYPETGESLYVYTECSECVNLRADIARLQAEVQRLREALAFYAERGNWAITTTGVYNILALHSGVLNDRGKRAQDVLAALEAK